MIMEWQPIETAPRDGTPVLIWLDDEGFCVKGIWRRPPGCDEFMWWIPEMDAGGFHEPSHWMPLPAPPGQP